MEEKEKFQVRDIFNPDVVKHLAEAIKKHHKKFDSDGYCDYVIPKLEQYSFQERRELIADGLIKYLPEDFEKSVNILLKALPDKIAKIEFDSSRIGVICMSLYVSKNGLDHFDTSMSAFYEMTQRVSSEFDVRPFIDKYTDKAMNILKKWAQDENFHVRRLASECCRPKLPWAMQLKKFVKDPSPILEVLELLKEDPEEFVRRSVANNLNDIAKDHPHITIKTLKKWKSIDNKGTQWIIKHAARTLLKQGHSDALELLGYPTKVNIDVKPIKLSTKKLHFGDTLIIETEITSKSKKKQNLLIDYIVYYMKANGKLSPKVYKITQTEIKPGETIPIVAKRQFKEMTTRKFYPGEHNVALQINGEKYNKIDFELIIS